MTIQMGGGGIERKSKATLVLHMSSLAHFNIQYPSIHTLQTHMWVHGWMGGYYPQSLQGYCFTSLSCFLYKILVLNGTSKNIEKPSPRYILRPLEKYRNKVSGYSVPSCLLVLTDTCSLKRSLHSAASPLLPTAKPSSGGEVRRRKRGLSYPTSEFALRREAVRTKLPNCILDNVPPSRPLYWVNPL
ncbi:hypothetical protein KIL84_022151 [Mauremys mutica]|uniref:Uncharacterized protein n=1 Tax=Mauremys mutica TaxID=74926 RepID=A0A9D3X9F1_9SAUR|nr:hypothetical protein KIL84_022151 [Mauremys mutica]